MSARNSRLARWRIWLSAAALAWLVDGAILNAAAQAPSDEYRTATRLGGPRRFSPPLRDLAAVKRMVARPAVEKDLRSVLDQAGIGSLGDQVLGVLRSADPAVMRETTFPVGSTLE